MRDAWLIKINFSELIATNLLTAPEISAKCLKTNKNGRLQLKILV